MARRYKWRKVRMHFSYDIAQAAKVLDCSVATIRNWVREGLPLLTDRKPFLIDGRDLRAFARAKSDSYKWPRPETNARWTYFPCFRCKAFRKPALMMADCVATGPQSGRLECLCEVCTANMVRIAPPSWLNEIRQILDVTVKEAQPH